MEELKIGVLLKDSNDQNRILRHFEKKNWAKLKEALLCLKMVNGDMRLTLITGVFYGDRVKVSKICLFLSVFMQFVPEPQIWH
jgi:hypothetical protein